METGPITEGHSTHRSWPHLFFNWIREIHQCEKENTNHIHVLVPLITERILDNWSIKCRPQIDNLPAAVVLPLSVVGKGCCRRCCLLTQWILLLDPLLGLPDSISIVLRSSRNRRRQRQDDPGHDLDHHPAFRHPGHLSRGDDGQGRSPPLVPKKNSSIQERQCPEFPHQVGFFVLPVRIPGNSSGLPTT